MTRIQLGASIAMHFWRFVEVSHFPLKDIVDLSHLTYRKQCRLRRPAQNGKSGMVASNSIKSFLSPFTASAPMFGKRILLSTSKHPLIHTHLSSQYYHCLSIISRLHLHPVLCKYDHVHMYHRIFDIPGPK